MPSRNRVKMIKLIITDEFEWFPIPLHSTSTVESQTVHRATIAKINFFPKGQCK